MNKGFVSIVVIAIIGVVTLVAGGGVYGVYKYSQIADEKQALTEELDNRKDVEIERLQDKVSSLEYSVGTTTETVSEDSEALVTYYVKPETANVRPCIDISNLDCAPIGQYKQNTELKLPFINLTEMGEWVSVEWNGKNAFISKAVLTEVAVSYDSRVNIKPSTNVATEKVEEKKVAVEEAVKKEVMQTVQVGENYHYRVLSTVEETISINKSFKNWLEDKDKELIEARSTMMNYPGGGLLGKLRDSSIKVITAERQVVSDMISFSNKEIAKYEGILEVVNSTKYATKEDLEWFLTVEVVQKDLDKTKKIINDDMDNIYDNMQKTTDAYNSF